MAFINPWSRVQIASFFKSFDTGFFYPLVNSPSGISTAEGVYSTEIERFIPLAIGPKHTTPAEYLHYK